MVANTTTICNRKPVDPPHIPIPIIEWIYIQHYLLNPNYELDF